MLPPAGEARVVSALRTTVAHALAGSDFYRRRVPRDFRLTSLRDFEALPILSRNDLVRLCNERLTEVETPPDFIAFTSGTSASRTPSFLYRSHSLGEQRALQDLFTALAQTNGKQPLTIKLISASHGLDLFGPRQGIFAVPFEQPYHLPLIVDLLRRSYRFRDFTERVVCIVSPLNILKILTAKLVEGGVDGSDFAIAYVTSYAWRLSPHWDARLRSFWGATVIDAYGLSEVPGLSAVRCVACGFFHFDSSAYVEFVQLSRDTPAENGPVRLIATAFYPLADLVPIVRYDTGDVFFDRGPCSASGQRSFEFLGRRQHLLALDDSGERIISLGLIADALDGFPDVGRVRESRSESLGVDPSLGTPLFHCTHDGRSISIDVAVEPEVPQEKLRDLAEAMRVAILQRLVAFGCDLGADDIHVTTTDQRASIPAVRL